MVFKLRLYYVGGVCLGYTALFALQIYNSASIIRSVVGDYNNDIVKFKRLDDEKFDVNKVLQYFLMF